MSYLRKIVLDQTTESMSGTHGILYWRSILKRMKRAVGRSKRVRRRLLDLELCDRLNQKPKPFVYILTAAQIQALKEMGFESEQYIEGSFARDPSQA